MCDIKKGLKIRFPFVHKMLVTPHQHVCNDKDIVFLLKSMFGSKVINNMDRWFSLLNLPHWNNSDTINILTSLLLLLIFKYIHV